MKHSLLIASRKSETGPKGDPRTTLTHAPASSGYGPEVGLQNLRHAKGLQNHPGALLVVAAERVARRAGRLALGDVVDLENLRITRELDPNIAQHRHEELAERVELLP